MRVRARRIARVWLCLFALGCGGGSEPDTDEMSLAAAGKKATESGAGSTAAGSGMSTAADGGARSTAAGSGAGRSGGSTAGAPAMGGGMTGMMASAGNGSGGAPAGGMTGGSAAGRGGGAAGGGTAGGGSGAPAPAGERFSFFMASQAGLAKLADDPNGFGGDLRFGKADGLSGADEICRQLAETTAPGNGKTWRAFLSATKGPNGMPVHAIDRVGEGPWYDRVGRVFAMNKAGLMSARPQGADPLIVNDFPNEEGVPNHNPGTGIIDNHNTLTGSDMQGRLDAKGLMATCQDWTSSAKEGGKPRCGVSWPRAQLTHWISVLNEGGCLPGSTPPGAEAGPQGTVGALGGYGGFYCFALTP